MSVAAALAVAFQITVSIGTQQGVAAERTDSGARRAPRRIAVTEEMRRTAFKDAKARDLLLRARAARMTQDSLLVSYAAKSYQRLSAGMSLRETARERLIFRTETVQHVRWHKGVGARVEVLGARSAVPIAKEAESEVQGEMDDMASIPYFPGQEQLWVGNEGLVRAEVDEREIVHPIAEGSEAYYSFATGDSVLMSLPDGRRFVLRELRISARVPKWNVVVGSFWFEVERAQLVRAVYRFSVPMDIWAVANAEEPGSMDDVPALVRPLITPMLADVTGISIEYGLFDQRFWLPTLRALDGYARVSFMRVPFRMEQRFRYERVNGLDSMPAIPGARPESTRSLRDSLRAAGLDSVQVRDEVRKFRERRDSAAKVAREQQCRESGTRTKYRNQYDGALRVAVETPCDTTRLRHSSELAGSIFDPAEELFGVKERGELMRMLSMHVQPAWAPQPPSLEWGLAHTRFNRIEGFSSGALFKATLGKGYTASLGVRGSMADKQFNGHLTLARSNGRAEVRGTVFRRLGVSSDFGDPLSFGASLASLLYAHDEGFYHRAWGAELAGSRVMRGGFEWRLFTEQEWSATVENHWSLFGGAGDSRVVGNVVADRAWLHGGALRWRGSRGLDPAGWRGTADVRLEGATGGFAYGRAMLETGLTRGFGPLAASLTGAAGTTEGTVPAQRRFFLGGLQSVRGQAPGTGYGDTFWMGRFELGLNRAIVRPALFGDVGWAGPRASWNRRIRPMSGVGVGASFLDGMIRLDVARGLHPRIQTRVDLSLEARF